MGTPGSNTLPNTTLNVLILNGKIFSSHLLCQCKDKNITGKDDEVHDVLALAGVNQPTLDWFPATEADIIWQQSCSSRLLSPRFLVHTIPEPSSVSSQYDAAAKRATAASAWRNGKDQMKWGRVESTPGTFSTVQKKKNNLKYYWIFFLPKYSTAIQTDLIH